MNKLLGGILVSALTWALGSVAAWGAERVLKPNLMAKDCDAISTMRYKYMEYKQGRKRVPVLFDLENDPHENVNLAGKPEVAETEARLRACLREVSNQATQPQPRR